MLYARLSGPFLAAPPAQHPEPRGKGTFVVVVVVVVEEKEAVVVEAVVLILVVFHTLLSVSFSSCNPYVSSNVRRCYHKKQPREMKLT